ncbi:staphylopine uptake ABC transporter ATP-binding protein CntD [Marinicrinis sediminis]|uniref:Staphylopine uptake ABC transporter ATP-binding protein CntD n=1 Tax=Marinicrinis sediminis TaxID=1652465 RepID=A0ABW5R7S0_9BACL
MSAEPVLKVENLHVKDDRTGRAIVHSSSFQIERGKCLAIVGESGSGKSVTCRALMKLNKPWLCQSGQIFVAGEPLHDLPEHKMREKRGSKMGLIPQNGMSAFTPSATIGAQLKEILKGHVSWSMAETTQRIGDALARVKLEHPSDILKKYPHQLSGGMLQRIMIALMILLEPDLVIADEPTSALDTVTQAEVAEQFIRLVKELKCALLFVSHDLGVVRQVADDVLVMRHGVLVERGSVADIFDRPRQAYTKQLVFAKLELADHFHQVMGRAYHAERTFG